MAQPAYIKIKRALKAEIINRTLAPGQQLPAEAALAKKFGISRQTLREAIRQLQNEHLLVTKNGIGTFVTEDEHIMTSNLNELSSIGTMIKNAGYALTHEILSNTHAKAAPRWAEKLKLAPEERVVVIKRLQFADGLPVSFAYNIFPEKLVGDAFDKPFHAILNHLEERCMVRVVKAVAEIRALSPENPQDAEAAKALGECVMLVEQLHFDKSFAPVLLSYDYLKTDRINLVLQRNRED